MNDTPTSLRGRPRKTSMFAKKEPSPAGIEASSQIEEPVEASPLRPPLRDEDPRTRAAKRAAELRGHLGEIDEGTDKFYVDPGSIPDGWTYEWKRHSMYGKEDPAYHVQILRAGWSPVPATRHPEMMPDQGSYNTILREGMILMECPTEIVEERRRIDLKNARDQVRYKESQIAGTPDGTMTRDHARVRPSIKKGYEPMPIPEK